MGCNRILIHLLTFRLYSIVRNKITNTAAFFGSLLPITAAVFVILVIAGVGSPIMISVFLLGAEPLVPNVIPLTFEYGFMNFGLGTILVGLGGLLALISVFMKREDY